MNAKKKERMQKGGRVLTLAFAFLFMLAFMPAQSIAESNVDNPIHEDVVVSEEAIPDSATIEVQMEGAEVTTETQNVEENGVSSEGSISETSETNATERESEKSADGLAIVAQGATKYGYEWPIPYVSYRTHVQRIGWQHYISDGVMSGTTGRSLRLEGINIKLSNLPCGGGIQYRTHVQRIGWQGWRKDGKMAGTSGKSYRLEAIEIKLYGEMANRYDIYYRVHCQRFGWMGWAKNGQRSGSAGYSRRLEGIQIALVPKWQSGPGATYNGVTQCYTSPFKQKGK